MKPTVTALLLAVFLLAFAGTTVASTEYYVASDGNNDNPGTVDAPWRTIEYAIGSMVAGDVLNIRQGSYETSGIRLGFNGPETIIQGYPGETASIHKTRIRNPIFGINNSASNITFRNLHLSGEKYMVLTGWEHYSGNVWLRPTEYNDQPTEIRFDWEWSTNSGRAVSSLAEVDSSRDWYYDRDTAAIYAYSEGDPDSVYSNPGINQIDDYDSSGIQGGSSSSVVTIDNVHFSGFSHGGVKGSSQWHIKNSYFENIGTDSHDHHIYGTGQHSIGNEAIIEHNYFGFAAGYAIHLYSDPSHYIVRYNVVNSGFSQEFASGIILSGNKLQVYGNTVFDAWRGIFFFRASSYDNVVKNNLLFGNGADFGIDTAGSWNSFPLNNIVEHNYLGSSTKCVGCVDRTDLGGDDYRKYVDFPNILDSVNPFIVSQPLNFWDFRLNSGTLAIDNGVNLGSAYSSLAIDPGELNWPPNLVSQNDYGESWEIGAFVYDSEPTPTPTQGLIPGDINGDGKVNLFDYNLLIAAMGTANAAADLNADGVVDILDYGILMYNFGR